MDERAALRMDPATDPSADSIIAELPPIGLSSLGAASLMDRVDEKFVLPRTELAAFLMRCAPAYRALEVRGRRHARYRTTYFDTADLSFYHEHLTGRLPRRKVRMRLYADSGDAYLEVKRRDNRGRTMKARTAVANDRERALEHLASLPPSLTEGLSADALRAVMTSDFTRVTLVDLGGVERVTIDSGISFSGHGDAAMFPALTCIEVKQARRGPSPALAALRSMRQRPSAFSKYCLGIASVVPGVPAHRFKPLLDRLERIERGHSHGAMP